MYFHDISYYFRLPILYLQEDDESDLMGQENDDNVADGTDANDVQQVAADDELSVVTAD